MAASYDNRRIAWKTAAKVFLLSRLLFLALSCLSIYVLLPLFPPFRQRMVSEHTLKFPLYDPHLLLYSWLQWDVKAFVNISNFGYRYTPDVAFFPLWPLLQHLGGLALGGVFPLSYYLAGLLLSNCFFYLALVLFYRLLAVDVGPEAARRALYCLAFAPYALFYFAGYSESVFLCLCLAVFLLLRRGKTWDWWLAGALSFLAVLSRSSGIVLALPYLAMYYHHFWTPSKRNEEGRGGWPRKLLALVPIVLIPSAILAYMLYLYQVKGNPYIFQTQEQTIWLRQLTMPWDTIRLVILALTTSSNLLVVNMLDVTFVLVALATVALGWTRIPWHYRLFALALAIFSLSFPTHTLEPLASQPRYMLSIFPIFAMYGIWGKNRTVYRVYLGLAFLFLVVFTSMFLGSFWVA